MGKFDETAFPIASQRLRPFRPGNTGSIVCYYIALIFSFFGDQFYFVSLAWIAALSGEPSSAAIVLASGTLSRSVVLIFGGSLADKLGLGRALRIAVSCKLVYVALASLLLFHIHNSLLLLICLSVAFGIVDALFLPSLLAAGPLLSDGVWAVRVQAARTLLQRLALIAGAPLAGLAVSRVGPLSAFSLNFPVLIIVATGLFLICSDSRLSGRVAQLRSGEAAPSLFEMVKGFRSIISSRTMLSVLSIAFIADFAVAGPLNSALPQLAVNRSWGPEGSGVVLGFFGVGAVIAALCLMFGSLISRPLVVAGVASAAGGGATLFIPFFASVWVSASFASLAGFFLSICGTLVFSEAIRVSSQASMGRTLAIVSLAGYVALPLSYATTGLTIYFGVALPFIVGGISLFIGGLVSALSAWVFRDN